MPSLNVPVPAAVAQLAARLARAHPTAVHRERGERTLVCKRLPDDPPRGALAATAREVVAGTAPFDARVTAIDLFEDPPAGEKPVVYLAVESDGLRALHERLCRVFDPVDGMEGGDDYDPHVTIARGGSPSAAHRLASESVDPIEWTVDAVEVYDHRTGRTHQRLSLDG